MIINPSAQTMIPRRNSFRNRAINRRRRAIRIPGGKQLLLGVAKVLFASVAFLFICTFFMNASVSQVSAEIVKAEMTYNELVNANVLLRAEKAHLFSPEAIGTLAGGQLAIHIPVSGQYRSLD